MNLIQADVIQHLRDKQVQNEFDMVIADPPYSSGGLMRADRNNTTTTKYSHSDSANQSLPDFLGDNKDQRSYTYWSHLWMSACLDALKPGGIMVVFTDWRQLPATSDAVQAAGFVWRGIVPWYKGYGRPTANRYSNSCEYMLVATKGARPANSRDPQSLYAEGFFHYKTPRKRIHTTQKPVELYKHLMQITHKGSRILDPFLGSGTCAIAAYECDMDFTGLELSQDILQIAKQLINDHI